MVQLGIDGHPGREPSIVAREFCPPGRPWAGGEQAACESVGEEVAEAWGRFSR